MNDDVRGAHGIDAMNDPEYLWDRRDPPDAEIVALEETLAPLGYQPRPLPNRSWQRLPWTSLAAAAFITIATCGAWFAFQTSPTWAAEIITGAPTIDSRPMGQTDALGVDEWLETDEIATARVEVSNIGSVTIYPNSRVRLVATRSDEHRLELARGRLDALILAPPRLFFVNTPSAVAVDLGCAYTLEVDERGEGMIHVTIGWVALEADGPAAIVPMGGVCRTRIGRGPGTPYFEDAPRALRAALHRFDLAEDQDAALAVILRRARVRDTLTLWHLLARTEPPQRESVLDRMLTLASLPEGVTRAGVLLLDADMLDAWYWELDGDW